MYQLHYFINKYKLGIALNLEDFWFNLSSTII